MLQTSFFKIQQINKQYLLTTGFLIIAAVLLLLPEAAHAATDWDGSPWQTPGQKFIKMISGPIPFVIGIAAIVGAGATLVFGGAEINGFIKTLCYLILVIAIIANAATMFSWMFGGSGATITPQMLDVPATYEPLETDAKLDQESNLDQNEVSPADNTSISDQQTASQISQEALPLIKPNYIITV